MLIQIKSFQGGMVTNADPGDLGAEFVVKNENFLIETPGRIFSRPGRSAVNTINTLNFDNLKFYSPSNNKLDGTNPDSLFLGFDFDNGNKLKSLPSNIMGSVTATDLGTAYSSNTPTAFDLQDHGTEFRFAPNNLNHSPKILQFIARNFFEGSSSLDEYVFQNALPDYPSTTAMDFKEIVAYTTDSSNSGVNIATGTYRYKLAPLFDGIQELPMKSSYKGITVSTNNVVPNLKVQFSETVSGSAPNKNFTLNPRITAIKIYRETDNSGTYYHINTIPINTKTTHRNVVSSMAPGSVLPGKDYVYSDAILNSSTQFTSSSGIFATPQQTITNGIGAVVYRWFVLTGGDTITSGGGGNVHYTASSPLIATATSGTSGNGTHTWSNGPLTDSNFVTRLQKGFLTVHTQPSGTPNYLFDSDDAVLVRVLSYNTNNGFTLLGDAGMQASLSGVVWHNKAVHLYSLSDDERFMANEISGGVFRNYQNNVSTEYLIVNSIGKSIYLDENTNSISSNAGEVFRDYSITKNSDNNIINFYDTGLTNGSPQPFPDEFKVKVNYKFSQMMGNRLFVGNVRLDPGGDDEDHPDWIIYSEPGMPDILPIVNYIQIKDQQGGEVVGMDKILDSLVILMSRGIFRLDVGSTGDPADFILMESNKNLGCIAPKGIVNVNDNIFFCANDNIYQISSNFTFTPISEPIKDLWTATNNKEKSRLFFDVERNRLICTFGSAGQTHYLYDLTHNSWSKWVGSTNPPDFFTIDDTLKVYAINGEDTGNQGGGSGGQAGGGNTGGGGGGGATP